MLLIDGVTPHAGVRIEIWRLQTARRRIRVTPHAGVRIEIAKGKHKEK